MNTAFSSGFLFMWLFIIAGLLVFGFCIVLVATSGIAAGVFYGESRSMSRWIVENKRREKRTLQTMRLWQDKALERSGAGSLVRQRAEGNDQLQASKRRIVSPSQAIAQMRENEGKGLDPNYTPPVPTVKTQQVPQAVASSFLKDVAHATDHTN